MEKTTISIYDESIFRKKLFLLLHKSLIAATLFLLLLPMQPAYASDISNKMRNSPSSRQDRPDFNAANTRAQALVNQMTLEEKSALLYGYGTRRLGEEVWQVYVKGNTRLGIPDMVQGDAPSGIWQGSHAVTQMPNSAALAATFSHRLAWSYGNALGAETRALGYGVLHGPNVDVLRDPRHGRAHESFGEDPYLVGQMASAYVRGLQSHRVIADAKHYVVNTVEKDRMTVDARIDERTLHEIYLAPFQDVVQMGQVGMIMCAYNKINGTPSCENEALLNDLLREKWGFEGIIRTDAGAAHALNSLQYGVVQEFRNEAHYGKALINAVRAGQFPQSAVDDAVRTILRTMILYGIFDDPPQRTGADLQTGAEIAQQLAENAIVLLRNEKHVLPLAASDIRRIAVIGAGVDNTLTAGGPTNAAPQGKDTILQALRDKLPHAVILHERGVDPIYAIAIAPGYPQLPSGALTSAEGKEGADAAYYDINGTLLSARTDTCLCYTPGTTFSSTVTAHQSPPENTARVVWNATFEAGADGLYGVDLSTNGQASLSIDGQIMVTSAGDTGQAPPSSTIRLVKGAHQIHVEYDVNAIASPWLKVGWNAPPGAIDRNIRAAANAAATADAAIVVVRDLETEGIDRPSLMLPNHQDRLIQAVADANPRTIVVLTTGSAVTMPWESQVPAIVEAWYGGTRGGAALARVLFGDVNPSGKLPITFPRREQDLPTYATERFPGINQVVEFSEGLNIGYRFFNTLSAPAPRYPFGFGLSYTTFTFSGLELDRSAFMAGYTGPDGTLKHQRAVTATFTVTNTGDRAGAAVPQIYLQYPDSAQEPVPLLKGYKKVMLAAGESKTISLTLDQHAFSIYSAQSKQWTVTPGDYQAIVGNSSVDRALVKTVQVTAAPQR